MLHTKTLDQDKNPAKEYNRTSCKFITEDYFTKHTNIAIYKIIKTESIYQSYKNDKLDGLGSETKWSN